MDLQFGYCSDVSPRNDPRGLCANNYFSSPQDSEGYKDGHFKCHCQRNVPPFTLSDSEPCGMDAVSLFFFFLCPRKKIAFAPAAPAVFGVRIMDETKKKLIWFFRIAPDLRIDAPRA